MAVTHPRLGVVYTPRDVCEPMVRTALAPLLATRDPRTLRIVDPAIGEGAFLVEIVRVLAEAAGDTPATRRAIAAHCIHGVDIDPRAVGEARAAVERFVGAPVPELREHLRTGDALQLAWPARFDALVANPPYIRQEKVATKTALRGYEVYDGVADLYVYFVELAHRIADRFCIVIPNKWLTVAYARPLRAFLAARGSVEGIVDFTTSALFDDADAFPSIVWGTSAGAKVPPRAHRTTASVAAALATPGAPHPHWTDEPWHIDAPRDAALLAKLERWPRLGEQIRERFSRGVVTGLNRAFVIDAATRARLLAAEPAAAPLIRPFVKGRDIRRWRAAHADRYILLIDRGTSLDVLPHVRAHLAQFRDALEPGTGRKPGRYAWFELQDPVVPLAKSRAPRLLYQDIQTQPACCLDETGELVPDTTVWILPSSDPFLLALLNSPLYAWYARRRFPPALNGAVRPKLEYMRALPIAQPDGPLRARIEELVHAQLATPARDRDEALARAVCDAYELTDRERALLDER